jgi:predicted site-specific integrase-resolvase
MKYLSSGDVARQLGVDSSTVRRWILDPIACRRKFPNLHRTAGGHARIPESDVARLLSTTGVGKALLYIRVPSERHGALLDAGVRHLRQYARERNYALHDVVTEMGSGFSDRPQLDDLRSQIRKPAPPFEVLLVERLDRIVILGAREFQRWAAPVRVEVAGASCPKADHLYQQEVLRSLYYPLADTLALCGATPRELNRVLEQGLEAIAAAVGL